MSKLITVIMVVFSFVLFQAHPDMAQTTGTMGTGTGATTGGTTTGETGTGTTGDTAPAFANAAQAAHAANLASASATQGQANLDAAMNAVTQAEANLAAAIASGNKGAITIVNVINKLTLSWLS